MVQQTTAQQRINFYVQNKFNYQHNASEPPGFYRY